MCQSRANELWHLIETACATVPVFYPISELLNAKNITYVFAAFIGYSSY